MKALKKIAESDGYAVTGSDLMLSGHDARFAEGADLIVYSSAVPSDNPELIYAAEHGIKTLSRAEYLGRVSAGYGYTVAVAGSHGKTTVTAMLGCIFAGRNATVHLGGAYRGECGHVGGKRYFITEACEYRRNFLHLLPNVSVVLNVELDHTDYYRDLADITNAFEVFSRSAPLRVLCADDDNSAPLRSGRYITFGLGGKSDFRAENIVPGRGGTTFTLVHSGRRLCDVKLKVMGRHNVLNAVAAAAVGIASGVSLGEVKSGLESFTGVGRRLELLGSPCGCDVYSDYAHHPHEIVSTLTCLREAGYSHITAVFEPHTYSRTKSLCSDFADALTLADDILLADIYAAREDPVAGVSSQMLCRKILDGGRTARCFATFFELNEAAAKYLEGGGVIVYLGAGTIDIAARKFVEIGKG